MAELDREREAATRLGRIGFDTIAGFLEGGMQRLAAAPELVGPIERVTARTLYERLDSLDPPLIIDVRTTRQWNEGHIDGAVNLPLAHLPEHFAELPADRQLIVYCASGYRSAIAVSLLRREGLQDVASLVGGLSAWNSAQLDAAASA